MIRFKVDGGDAGLIALGKKQAKRLIASGLHTFTRTFLGMTIRCVKVMNDFNVTILTTATSFSIAYRMGSEAIFPEVMYSTVLSISPAGNSSGSTDFGVPADMNTLVQFSPVQKLRLTALDFSDAADKPINITPVNDVAIYRNARVTTNISTHVAGAQHEPALPGSRSLFVKLFNDKHAAALVSYATAHLAIKRPAGFERVFNTYINATWRPVYFWKETVDGVEDVWVLSQMQTNWDTLSGFTSNEFAVGDRNIPCTGDLDADRFETDDLTRNIVNVQVAGAVPLPKLLSYHVNPPVWRSHPFMFMKAKLTDLHAHRTLPTGTIDIAKDAPIPLTFFDTTYMLPTTGLTLFVLPGATPGFFAGTIDFDNGAYHITAQLSGTEYTTEGGQRRVNMTYVVSTFGVYRPVWDNITAKPDADLTPPSSPLATWDGSIPQVNWRTHYDYNALVTQRETTGIPISSSKFTLVDMRQYVWPSNPAYVNNLSTIYQQQLTELGGNRDLETFTLTCKLWSDYFTGVFFSARAVHRDNVILIPPNGDGDFSTVVGGVWGRYTSNIHSTNTGRVIRTEIFNSSFAPSVFTQFFPAFFYRAARGVIESLGEFVYSSPASGSSGSSVMFPNQFVPNSKYLSLGITSWVPSTANSIYNAKILPHVGYVEKFPPFWQPASLVSGNYGRYYKGVMLEAPSIPVNSGFDYLRVSLSHFHLGPAWWSSQYDGYFDAHQNIAYVDVPRAAIDLYDNFVPANFYAPVEHGGTPVGTLRASFRAVAIYYPNLKPNQHGYCLLKLGPDAFLMRLIYFFLLYSTNGLARFKTFTDLHFAHSASQVYLAFPAYKANVALMKSKVDGMLARVGTPNPPSENDFTELRALALTTLRSSYTVMANNFAPPELMDLFINSVTIVPYRK